MTDLAIVEPQRARWHRALRREALDATNRDDFAVGGLATRLRGPSVRLLLLPSDPEADLVRIDDQLWAWATDLQVVNVDGHIVRLGSRNVPTAHAAAMVESYDSRDAWNSYVAIHRSGAIEYGLGDQGAWERKGDDNKLVRVFNLVSVVTRTVALLKLGSALQDRTAVAGPFQLTVALHRTNGAFLGNVAEGWQEPFSWPNDPPVCHDEHLLWHLEVLDWPDDEAIRTLASSVGDRLEDAWGVQQRRYLARTGDLAGRLDVRRLHE